MISRRLKKNKFLILLCSLGLFMIVLVGCQPSQSKSNSTTYQSDFHVKDLSHDQYVENAKILAKSLQTYLEQSTESDFQTAYKAYGEQAGANENPTAGSVYNQYNTSLMAELEKTNKNPKNLSDNERRAYQAHMEEMIPTAWAMMQEEKELERYQWKDDQVLIFYENGIVEVKRLNEPAVTTQTKYDFKTMLLS